MAKTTIGDLVVKVSAKSDDFEKTMGNIERRTQAFATKLSAPLVMGAAATGSLAGLLLGGAGSFTSPIAMMIGQIDKLAQAADGMVGAFGGKRMQMAADLDTMFNRQKFDESAKAGLDRMKELRKESEKFGVSPQFVRAIKFLGGDEAENADKVLGKIVLRLGNLRMGEPGAVKALQPFIKDLDAFAGMDAEGAWRKVMDTHKAIANPGMQMQFLEAIGGGKFALQATQFLRGGSGRLDSVMGAAGMGYDQTTMDANKSMRAYNQMTQAMQEQQSMEHAQQKIAEDLIEQQFDKGNINAVQRFAARWSLSYPSIFGGRGAAQMLGYRAAQGGLKEEPPVVPMTVEKIMAAEKKDAAEQMSEAINKHIDAVRYETGLHKIAAHELELYSGIMKEATDEQREELRFANQVRMKNRLEKQFASPAEKLDRELAAIEAQGFLGKELQGQMLRKVLMDSGMVGKAGSGVARMIQRGSQEDYAISDEMLKGKDASQMSLQEMVDAAKMGAKAGQKTADNTGDVVTEIRGLREAIKVANFPK